MKPTKKPWRRKSRIKWMNRIDILFFVIFVFFSDQHNKQKILSLCVAFIFIFTIISIKFFFLLFYWSVFHRWLIRISLFSLIFLKKTLITFFVKLFTTFFLFFSFSLSFNYQDFFSDYWISILQYDKNK